jgi:hypothetical protein
MNCQTIQNRILALPDPRQVPGPLHEHLSGCAACLEWWKQAVRLEQLLEQLPVPAAPNDRKAAMIDDLTAAGPVIKSVPTLHRPSGRSPLAAVLAIPGLAYVGGLAAAILVLVGGWQLFRTGPAPVAKIIPSEDPLLKAMVRRDLALAQAKTPAQRLEVLGGMADDLSGEARNLARVATAEELRELSGLFRKVVDDGIIKQARDFPPHGLSVSERKTLFETLAAKLAEAGQEADRSARESPPHAQPALKTIADTARDGQTRLRAMAREVL